MLQVRTDKSIRAINNLTRICKEHLEGRYSIEVIDLLQRPQLAAGDQIPRCADLGTPPAGADQKDHRGPF